MTAAMPRCRVLMVIAGLPAGGAERQFVQIAAGLDRTTFDVGLLIFNSAERVHYREVLDAPLWFKDLGLSPRRDGVLLIPKLITGIRRAGAEFKPDLIHTTLNVANHAVRTTALFSKLPPIITSVRNDFRNGYSKREKFLEKILWRKSAHIVCNSDVTRQQLIEDLGLTENRTSTIFNGIDESFFIETQERPKDWPGDPVALTVGRFTDQKNHQALIEAIAQLAHKNALGDWSFVFLGEGPLKGNILESIRNHSLQDIVHVLPPIDDMPAAYRSAELFILPSKYEGMSNALMEAAAGACAVVVSSDADNADIAGDGRGWKSENALAQTLEPVLNLPKEEYQNRGRKALGYVREKFSVEKLVGKTAGLYRSVLDINP